MNFGSPGGLVPEGENVRFWCYGCNSSFFIQKQGSQNERRTKEAGDGKFQKLHRTTIKGYTGSSVPWRLAVLLELPLGLPYCSLYLGSYCNAR